MKSPRTIRPVLIDADTGVDDALAILLAMNSPEIKVEAITTVAGNVEVEKCTRNVRVILSYCPVESIPEVVSGARRPLKLDLVTAPEVHGKDGLGNTQPRVRYRPQKGTRGAVECIRRLCDRFPSELTIIALGPLTNIARAFRKYPDSVRKVRRIVSMGGAFKVPGNTGPVAEFNYFVDPHAAQIVLNSGLPVTVVPLDVTHQVILMRNQLLEVARRRRSALSSFIVRFTGNYMQYHAATEGFEGGYLHDPMAVAIALRPALATYCREHIKVECAGRLTRGMTIGDLKQEAGSPAPVVATTINCSEFVKMFQRRVLGV